MNKLKMAGVALVTLLALYGGMQAWSGARGLYADWQFVRLARTQQAIRDAQARQQQARPAVPAAPTVVPATP